MIKDFETNARHEDHLKKIRKKRAAESKKYQETIQHMKELREETYQKKNAELKQKLKEKGAYNYYNRKKSENEFTKNDEEKIKDKPSTYSLEKISGNIIALYYYCEKLDIENNTYYFNKNHIFQTDYNY